MRIRIATAATLILTACNAQAADPDIVSAIRGSLSYLEREGDRWLRGEVPLQEGSGCVSCHHVGAALWSHREAQVAGVEFPTDAIDDLRRRTNAFLAQPGKPRVVSATQMIMARAHAEGDLGVIRSASKDAGNWSARGQFPTQLRGEEESDEVMSLWALAALATLEPLDDETEARRTRALEWLEQVEPGISNEWTAARLVVAFRMRDDARVPALLDRLLETQNDDGGWSWLEDQPSNPFSTGQTVYALAVVGDDRSRGAVRRGVDYLLARQQADGTWETPSKLTSTKPSEGKDYIYRYWGTAWASIGLSRALDPAGS